MFLISSLKIIFIFSYVSMYHRVFPSRYSPAYAFDSLSKKLKTHKDNT